MHLRIKFQHHQSQASIHSASVKAQLSLLMISQIFPERDISAIAEYLSLFLTKLVLRVRSNCRNRASGQNVRSSYSDFLKKEQWFGAQTTFSGFLVQCSDRKSAISPFLVFLTKWPEPCVTCRAPHWGKNYFHQVWSRSTYPLRTYYVMFYCWHVTPRCNLDLWHLDLERGSDQLNFRENRPIISAPNARFSYQIGYVLRFETRAP